MIIQRLSQHLRSQNWFAVLLDLLVVIVGIYIGLQVDAWNSSRNERALETQYLERLLVDMNDSIAAQKVQLENFDDDTTAIDYIAQIQRAGSFAEADKERIIQGLNSVAWVPPPATNMITIRELQSTGNISLIRDVDIRIGIGQMERSFAGLEHDAALIMSLMPASAPEVMTWSYMEPNTPGEHRSVTAEEDPSYGYTSQYDEERMLSNPDVAKITSWISGWSKYQGSVMMEHHLETIEFRDLIQQKLRNSQ